MAILFTTFAIAATVILLYFLLEKFRKDKLYEFGYEAYSENLPSYTVREFNESFVFRISGTTKERKLFVVQKYSDYLESSGNKFILLDIVNYIPKDVIFTQFTYELRVYEKPDGTKKYRIKKYQPEFFPGDSVAII